MKQPILKVENLKKSFNGNNVLEGINLEIYPGEFFGIIGSSGSGKTTLLNVLIGFLQTDAGDVFFKKEDSSKYISVADNLDTMKKHFGFAAQTPSFYSNLTVFENLDYFGALYNLSKEARLLNINTLLELVELTGAKNIIAKNLSGGMQRRLDIACALIHNPNLLILDEPTSDLDPMLSKHIWLLLQKINKKGTTVIVASHHLTDIENICTRIGILIDKKLQYVGSLQELTGLLSKGQEIHVETYPGNYDKILKQLSDPLIISKENRGSEFLVRTTKPEKVLHKILHILSETDETLMEVSIGKVNLADVFSALTKTKK